MLRMTSALPKRCFSGPDVLRLRCRRQGSTVAAMRNSSVIVIVQISVGHLPKPAQHMPAVEFALFEIAGAAECNRAGVTKQLPLPLCRLNRERRIRTADGLTGNEATIDEIESQRHEMSDFRH
jgi:hypothetical protein